MSNDNPTDDWGTTSNDEMNFDTEGVDPDQINNRATVDKTGKYHFEIASAKERFGNVNDKGNLQFPNILCTCHVLQSVPGQSPEGSLYYHEVILGGKGGGRPDEWAIKATTAFLTGVGILKAVDGKFLDPETNSTKINIKTLATRLKGLQFIGDIKREKSNDPNYDDKYKLSWGRGAYQVDDPFVSAVPMNRDALAMIGKSPKQEQAAKSANGKKDGAAKSKEEKKETAAAGAAADPLNDPSL